MRQRSTIGLLLAAVLACTVCVGCNGRSRGPSPQAAETPPLRTTVPAITSDAASATAPPTEAAPAATRVPSVQAAHTITLHYTNTDGKPVEQEVNYLLYTPIGYGQDGAPEGGWPLILFLHGQLEWGDDPAVLTREGVPRMIAEGHDLPALVLSPQSREGQGWCPQTAMLAALLDAIQSQYDVNPRRVYLTGLSMGGYGAWALAMAAPERFAAVVPIAGEADCQPGDRPIPDAICGLRDVPVWAFHGEQDMNVPALGSIKAVQALEECGGSPRLTVYAELAHAEAWERAYADPELWAWLLEQERER